MKFLIDVNSSRILGNWLVEIGHDVIYVSDTDRQMTDSNILEWAVIEKRIIVTTDNDFEQMIWQQQKRHCGVLRLANLPRVERKMLLMDALLLHGQDLLNGKIVIAMKNKFRIRQPILRNDI
jgi:predicted nuclease of predicted toxin-antitoxin system